MIETSEKERLRKLYREFCELHIEKIELQAEEQLEQKKDRQNATPRVHEVRHRLSEIDAEIPKTEGYIEAAEFGYLHKLLEA